MTKKAKRRLTNFDFSGENHHVALVHRAQNGAANGYQTLIMKSSDVSVELSMAEFLTRFFNIWSGDAEFLARLLGYSDDTDALWDDQKLAEQVTLLEKVRTRSEDDNDSDERFPLDMGDLSDLEQEDLRELTKSLAEASNITITDLTKDADGASPVGEEETSEESEEDNPKEVEKMADVEKSAVEAAVEKARQDLQAAHEAELAELRKSLEAFETEKAQARKETFVTKAADFEALGVEDTEKFAVALMKATDDEDMKVLVEVLEKSLTIAKSVDELQPKGSDAEPQEALSGVRAAIEARKANK